LQQDLSRISASIILLVPSLHHQDVTDLFKYEIRDALSQRGRTNWESTASCDVLATFIDESAPWWILAIGFFYVIGNIALSSTGNPSFLRCMLWCYMAFDIGVGCSFSPFYPQFPLDLWGPIFKNKCAKLIDSG